MGLTESFINSTNLLLSAYCVLGARDSETALFTGGSSIRYEKGGGGHFSLRRPIFRKGLSLDGLEFEDEGKKERSSFIHRPDKDWLSTHYAQLAMPNAHHSLFHSFNNSS